MDVEGSQSQNHKCDDSKLKWDFKWWFLAWISPHKCVTEEYSGGPFYDAWLGIHSRKETSVYQIRIQFRLQPTSLRSYFFAKWIAFSPSSTRVYGHEKWEPAQVTAAMTPIIELASLVGWYPKHTALLVPDFQSSFFPPSDLFDRLAASYRLYTFVHCD